MAKEKNPVPLIAHVIYKLGVGGLENGLVNLINQMPAEQYRHIIFCLKDSSDFSNRLTRDDVQIIELNKKEGQDWKSLVTFYHLLKQHKVDIIHTRNLAAIEYQVPALLAGVKFRVHSEHGWDVFDPDGNNKKYQILRRGLGLLIKVFIPLSLHLQSYLIEKVKIPSRKITRICNGVDTQKFHPDEKKQLVKGWPFSFKEQDIYFGTVGRMHGVKDQITLVSAFINLIEQNPELKSRTYLILVGDGPLRQVAIEQLKEHHLLENVWLPGERKDIFEIMSLLDIFVLPSQAEGISNTILEAMATGLPIIATDVGGNPELVKDGETGILVPPSDSQAMATAMLTLLSDNEKRQQQGKMSYQRVQKHFSIQTMVSKYINVYNSLIKNRKL